MFELDDARRDELVETWARRLVDRGFGAVAVFLLEAHKPVSGVGAHAVLAFGPLLAPLVTLNTNELAAFMHKVDNVERLIQRVEQLEQARRDEQDAQQRRLRDIRRRARRIKRLRRKHRDAGG